MIRLNLTDVREFLKRSRRIQNPGVLPVLSYVQLLVQDHAATLTKTNMAAWCIHDFDTDTEPAHLLLDEKILSAFVAQAQGAELTLEVKKGKVQLSDGRAQISHEWVDPATYPATPVEAGVAEAVALPRAVLEAIRLAHPFVQHLELESQYSFVHLSKGEVFATNGYVVYHKAFEDELPDVVLREESAAAIGEYDALMYYSAGNYDFFDTGRTRYGFIRPEHITPDYRPLLAQIRRDAFFTVSRRELIAFCELALAVIPKGHVVVVQLHPTENEGLMALCRNDALSINLQRELSATGVVMERSFSFQPHYVTPYLKALPYETIHFSSMNGAHYALWDGVDEAWTGILAGMKSD